MINKSTTKILTKPTVFRLAKGFRGRSKNCYSIAIRRVQRALQYGYRDRRTKRRDHRKAWIMQINAGAREQGVKYNRFMDKLYNDSGVALDRKILSGLARNEPFSFQGIINLVKTELQVPIMVPKKSGHLFSAVVQTPKISYKKVMKAELEARNEQLSKHPAHVYDRQAGHWAAVEQPQEQKAEA